MDQRGLLRPVGGSPDIGAYEFGSAAGYAAWAAEMISAGLEASFTGDAEDDGSSNGSEYALGTDVLISDPDSPINPAMVTNSSGWIATSFGLNPDAALDTKWIIKRSTDLVNFTDIYNYDRPDGEQQPGRRRQRNGRRRHHHGDRREPARATRVLQVRGGEGWVFEWGTRIAWSLA